MKYLTFTTATLLASTILVPTAAFAQDSEYRIVEDELTLDVHMHWGDKYAYDSQFAVEQRARELTGIALNGTASSVATNSLETFNLMLAAGDLPDIVGGNSLRDNFNKFGAEGAFIPLNDLIAEHAPNLNAILEANPDIRAAITAGDGNIYHAPYLADGDYARAYFIRMDWLDKLGLEVPNTVDELYDVLVAFRDQDPNGNGEQDEISDLLRYWQEVVRLVTLWDARTAGTDSYHTFYIKDGQVTHGYTEENYRTGISNLAQWYEEGLIDPEIFTRGSRSREHLLGNDLGGMTHDWFASTAGYNDAFADTIEGFSFRPFLPPASVSGVRLEENRRTKVKPDGWAISYANEHPEETMRYFDFWYAGEGRLLANFGIEGEHYDLVDGEPMFKEEVLTSTTLVNAQLWSIGAQIPRGFLQDYSYEEQWTNQIALEGIELYETEDLLVDEFLGVAMLPEEQEVYDRYWNAIETYMLEMQQSWILGARDVNEDWDDYIERLEDLHFPEVQEVMQTAYDRQYGG